ncbi:MAG: type II TA system antitoxin MqsA family protein [Phycisphaerae bacterium]
MKADIDKRTEVFCPNCEDYRLAKRVRRDETYKVRDQQITIPVERLICVNCGEPLGSDEHDQAVLNAVYAEYRRRADLLTPQRIKEIRRQYRLSQKSFAALLGMSEATINRYEQGGLQDSAHDTAIRACEKPDVLRDLLERRGHLLSDWQRKRVEQSLAGESEPVCRALEHLGEVDWICMPDEVTDRTGYRRFDYERFAATVTWFCNRLGDVSRTTINKLLFYADFLSFKTSTVSLTGAAYRRLEYGPVPADYGGLLSRMESEDFLTSREEHYPTGLVGCYYSSGPKASELNVEFSEHEQRVLEKVAETLGRLSAKAISENSHNESAWRNTGEKQLISYLEASDLSISLDD